MTAVSAPSRLVMFISASAVLLVGARAIMYLLAQTPGGPRLVERILLLPFLFVIAMAVAVTSGVAGLRGLFQTTGGMFERTAKCGTTLQTDVPESEG
jgi:hypothetical protein